MPKALGAARAHVGADAGVGVQRPVPAVTNLHALDRPSVALDQFDPGGLVSAALLLGGLGVKGVELLAVLPEVFVFCRAGRRAAPDRPRPAA